MEFPMASPPTKTVSNPGSDRTRASRIDRTLMLSTDDSWMPPNIATNTGDFRFVNCSQPGCASTSAFSEYGAMTLRAGYNTCTNHTTQDIIRDRVMSTIPSPNATFIFYDLEVTSTNEIDQLSAVTPNGDHIDLVVRTTVRKNNSPIVGKLSPLLYMVMATEPATAMRAFMEWVRNILRKSTGGKGVESDVVLVAHNGMNHDHVLLVKTMLVWGIMPPKWRFADSLPIFKLVTAPGETATLDVLAAKYAPWFQHVHHDGLSDATAIMHVVTKCVPNWQMACLAFSNSSEDFITSVGLNTFRIRPALPFPTASTTDYMV